jgi:hypothetical protein
MIDRAQIRTIVHDWIKHAATRDNAGDAPGLHIDEVAPMALARLHLAIAEGVLHAALDIEASERIGSVPALLIRLRSDLPLDVDHVTGFASLEEHVHLGMPAELVLVARGDELERVKKGRPLRKFQHTRPVLAFLSDWSDQWNETLRDIWIMSRS